MLTYPQPNFDLGATNILICTSLFFSPNWGDDLDEVVSDIICQLKESLLFLKTTTFMNHFKEKIINTS